MNLFNTLIQYRGWKLYDLPRSIFTAIDDGVYSMIGNVYELIVDIANVSVFSTDTLQAFYGKIYALLSIFMLFKLSFSIVSYILDPSKTFDKNAGFGKLITNILVMFIMMLSAPVAFKYLTKLQSAILDDNAIENFVFNIDGTYDSDSIKMADDKTCEAWLAIDKGFSNSGGRWRPSTIGDGISIRIYRVFFNLSEEARGSTGFFSKEDLYNSYNFCENIDDATVKDMTSAVNDYVEKTGKGMWYVVDYRMFLATAFGVLVLLMFISIAFDIAVRAVKLGFLQLIAPVPIISYIDPKSGKDGIFQRWIKEVGKTWVSLFIRLFSVYFAVFIVSKVEIIFPKDYKLKSSMFFVELFVIIGALMFAKQLPQLLEQLFPGMKMGKMQLNPFKKVADEALGGKLVTGAAVGAAAMGARGLSQAGSNLYAFGRNRHNLKKGIAEAEAKGDYDKAEKLKRQLKRNNFGRAVGTTFGGLAGGATRGLKSGYNTGKSGSGNIFKGTKQDLQSGNTKRNNRAAINDYNAELKSQLKDGKISKEDYENGKYDFWNRNVTEKLDKVSGVKNSYGGYGYYNNKVSELQRKIDNNNEIEHSMRDAVASYSSNHGISTLDLYDFHKNNSNKSNIELEQSLLDKYTKDSSGNVIRGTTSDGKIAFKNTDEDRKLQAEYEKERKLLAGYKEQRSQLEAINKVDEETKEMKKEQKQYKEMADSMPNDVKEK